MILNNLTAEPISYQPSWSLRLKNFLKHNPLIIFGSSIFVCVLVSAIFASYIAPYDPNEIDFTKKFREPSLEHLMGTDLFGRDIFSRVIYGARTSLIIGITVLSFSIAIGLPIGLAAGYFGGRIDMILMRITDVFLAFPPLLLPIAISAALGAGLFNAMLALAVSWFPWYARIARGSALSIREEMYVNAARSMGASSLKVILRHVMPNSWIPIIVQASMDFGYAILAAASLSFIGIGAKPPSIEWGLMVSTSRSNFLDFWWTVGGPGLAIFLAVMAANLVGDGIRDMLDPKHRS
jgi:peptide/nickel transport system permease protein